MTTDLLEPLLLTEEWSSVIYWEMEEEERRYSVGSSLLESVEIARPSEGTDECCGQVVCIEPITKLFVTSLVVWNLHIIETCFIFTNIFVKGRIKRRPKSWWSGCQKSHPHLLATLWSLKIPSLVKLSDFFVWEEIFVERIFVYINMGLPLSWEGCRLYYRLMKLANTFLFTESLCPMVYNTLN